MHLYHLYELAHNVCFYQRLPIIFHGKHSIINDIIVGYPLVN